MSPSRESVAPPTLRPPRTPKSPPPEIARSPRIDELAAALERGEESALGTFWSEVMRRGTPLVEGHAGDDRIITFVWRDRHGSGSGTRQVVLMANRLTDPSVWDQSVLERLPGTDVWHRSYVVPADWRATYQLAPDDGAAPVEQAQTGPAARWRGMASVGQADPFNAATLPARRGGTASIVELPGAPPQPWLDTHPQGARGTVTEHAVAGERLARSRRVWVHRPAHLPAGDRPDLLILLDGDDWAMKLGLPAILDNLARDLPRPLVTAMVDSGDHATRVADLTDGRAFRKFLIQDLPAWAAETFGTSTGPGRTSIAGQSLGGLTILRCLLEAPGRFGGAIAQSASLWWAPADSGPVDTGWLADEFAAAKPHGTRIHLEVGLQEWVLLPLHRQFRDAARSRGWAVSYHEFQGGHDRVCWRAGLPAAIAELARR